MSNSTTSDRQSQQEIEIIAPQDHFTRVSNQAIRDKRLNGNAFKVLCWLASHREDYKTTYKTISEQMGLAEGTISSSFKMLENLGYLYQVKAKKKNGFNDASKKKIIWVPPVDNLNNDEIHTSKIEANHTSKIEACHTSKIEVHKNTILKEDHFREVGAFAPSSSKFEQLKPEDRIKASRIKTKDYLYELMAGLVLLTPEFDNRDFAIRGEIAGIIRTLKELDAERGRLDPNLILERYADDIAVHMELTKASKYSQFKTLIAWLKDFGWSTDRYRTKPKEKSTQTAKYDTESDDYQEQVAKTQELLKIAERASFEKLERMQKEQQKNAKEKVVNTRVANSSMRPIGEGLGELLLKLQARGTTVEHSET